MMEPKCENCKWFRLLQLIGRNSGKHVYGYCVNTKHIKNGTVYWVYGEIPACYMYEGTDDQMEIKESEN